MALIETKAAVLRAPRAPVVVQPVSVAEPGPGEALIEMEACGLCHSDLFVAGLEKLPSAPLILGHEGIGRVIALGPGVLDWAVGDRAGVTFLASTCGACEWCQAGRERFCPKQVNFGYTANGALTGYALAPVAQLARVPRNLPAEAAAPLCCAGWTAYGALREARLERGQSVALFGMGGLGHMAAQFARHWGLRVAAVDPSEEKLELAREYGAEITVSGEDAGRTLQKQAGGTDAAVVLTASPAAIQQAFRGLKRTGTLVLVGLSRNIYELPITETVLKGITVRGSYLGTRQDLAEVFRLAGQGIAQAHVETHPLAEAPALLERLSRGELVGRAVIVFGEDS
jgi:propanol-preferring alcohol dehydrogenase